jgi:hypothetical protein
MECGICDGMRICSCKDYTAMRFQAAVAAMQGFCGSNILEKVMHSNDGSTKLTVSPNDIASHAINVADALIAELDGESK